MAFVITLIGTPVIGTTVVLSVVDVSSLQYTDGIAIGWSSDNPLIAQPTVACSTTDVLGVATVGISLLAEGTVTITASDGDRSASLLLTVVPSAVMTVTLTSTSDSWCTQWSSFAKAFYIKATDAMGAPVGGATVTLLSDELAISVLGSPVTSANGRVTVLATIASGGSQGGGITAVVGGVASGERYIQLIEPTLPAPRYLLGIDGEITDDDVARGLYASLSATGATTGDLLEFRWEHNDLVEVLAAPDEMVSLLIDPIWMNNGPQRSAYALIDSSFNARYSEISVLEVYLTDPDLVTGIQDLDPVQILEGGDGVINQANANQPSGVHLLLEEPRLTDPLTTDARLYAWVEKNEEIVGGRIMLPLALPMTAPFTLTDEALGYPLRALFELVGEDAHLEIFLGMTIDGELHSSIPAAYLVDIVAPGGGVSI